MEASVKSNMKEFRAKVKKYGKLLTDEGIKKAAADLSIRAENAVKRDFTIYFDQNPSQGPPGKTVRTAHLRSEVHAVIKSETSFGVGSSLPYARPHELGVGPYVIYPKATRLIALAIASGQSSLVEGVKLGKKRRGLATVLKFQKGGKTIFAKKVQHPGQKARHWMSLPMAAELQVYIDDQIKILESSL